MNAQVKFFHELLLYLRFCYCHFFRCSHSQLVFVTDLTTRELLKRWVEEFLDDGMMEQLQTLLALHRPELLSTVYDSQCPSKYSYYIEQLSKTSLMVALMSVESLPIVMITLQRELTPEECRLLARSSPFCFRACTDGGISVTWIKESLFYD